MALSSHSKVRNGLGLLTAASFGVLTLVPSVARADGATSPTGKGIVGGALLGAEAVVTVEAIASVRAPWAYAVGGIVGAAGGGVAGHFAENSSDPHVPLYLLGGGMALLIPALVLTLNQTAYQPPADYQEDRGATGAEPAADVPPPNVAPGSPQTPASPVPSSPSPPNQAAPTTTPAPAGPQGKATRRDPRPATLTQLHAPIPFSMLELGDAGVRMGIPAVEVRPMFSAEEMRQYGVAQKEEVRVPVFRAVF